ncbi:MAG TPA: hypothetical protein VFO38_00175 [Candidatus Saccharimonadales bacterium]|nr:hypothetical protein [Candidatus Saccharimonadales bacterium]
MVALKDLRRNDRIVVPWYKSSSAEFRIESDDLTFTIEGGGTQRRIAIAFSVVGMALLPGLLIHTTPKRGAASIFVAKGLALPAPKEGSEKLGDTLTFGNLGKPCTAADHFRSLHLGGYALNQRLYCMPHDNSVLLAERHLPPRGKPSTCYYHVIAVNERDLCRK